VGKSQEELELIKIKKVDIEAVKAAIDISSFQQTKLLEIALNCRYYTSDYSDRPEESPPGQEVNYKRLSLLGGAIFGAVVTDYLYREYPELAARWYLNLKSSFSRSEKTGGICTKFEIKRTRLARLESETHRRKRVQ
jgi:dsRNA-specific ribonuclease